MTDLLVLIFPSRERLLEAVVRLKTLEAVQIKHSAVIARADDGETVVYEDDISLAEGSLTGGTLGSLISALGVAQMGAFLLPGVGPIVAIGAGALIGGLIGGTTGGVTAGLIDFGFDNDQLDRLAGTLQAGRTALVIAVDERAAVANRLQSELRDLQVELMLPSGSA